MRTLYEIAESRNTTVGELTGTRRKYSTVRLPDRIAQAFGLSDGENRIIIEHHDEGISSNEIPFIAALWELHAQEEKRR